MNAKEIDIVNVILIIVSLTLAINLPFQLFLFSYAFLGPLHYTTEINWLKEKNYFLKETKWIALFILCALLVALPMFLRLNLPGHINKMPWAITTADVLSKFSDEILLMAIVTTIGLIYFKKTAHQLLFLIPALVATYYILNYFPDVALFTAIFVPTLIHVYLFTLLFMIYGTLNSKSKPGIIAIILVIAAPFIIMMCKVNPAEYLPLKESVVNAYNSTSFGFLNYGVAKFLLPGQHTNEGMLSAMGIKIQIFIAFAYTYHYLNWFSKTSIIGWNKNLSKSKLITITSIWIISIILYLYNYKVGFIALLLLSLVHVFLEFPLNITSIKGILAKVKSK